MCVCSQSVAALLNGVVLTCFLLKVASLWEIIIMSVGHDMSRAFVTSLTVSKKKKKSPAVKTLL